MTVLSTFINCDRRFIPVSVFFILIANLFIFVIILLRKTGGSDFIGYSNLWDYLENKSLSNPGQLYIHFELSLRLFFIFLQNFTHNINFFYALVYVFQAVIVYKVLSAKELPTGFLVFLSVFVVPYSFNAVGQGIASFAFLAFASNTSLKIYKSPIFLLAALLHKSGMFVLFALIFRQSSRFIRYIIFLTSTLLIAYLVNYYNAILPRYDFVGDKSMLDIIYRAVILSVILTMWSGTNSKDNAFVIELYALGFVIFLLLYEMSPVVAIRINMFFRVLEIVLIPRLINLQHKRFRQLSLLVIVMIYLPIFFKNIGHNSFNITI